MQKLRVNNFSISVDGFGAGPGQDLENPLGKNGMGLHQWFFPTDTFEMDIRLGGGVNTVRQFLKEALIDERHIAITPVILGTGERLLEGIDLVGLGYKCI